MGYAAKILADSVSPDGHRLTTMEVTFPRIVLAEFNTHRMLSRNSASSRAIPVEKRIKAVRKDPFVPEAFGQNQKGMQASATLTGLASWAAKAVWVVACYMALGAAWLMAKLKVHKQLANRLIEAFCWHTVIVTATDWDNFFALRCHPDAQPEIRKIAVMMREVYEASLPTPVNYGDWHLPLVTPSEAFDLLAGGMSIVELCLVSIGRCARVSYLTHDGKRDPLADIDLARKLQASGHMSPFEHVAQPMVQPITGGGYVGNLLGWVQYRKQIVNEDNFKRVLDARAT